MKITCLSRFFCRFQTFRLYQEPRNELLMWWLVASAAVVRHITFFCCSCASCAGWVVLWLPRAILSVVPRLSCSFPVFLPVSQPPNAMLFAASVPMSSPVFQPRRHGHRRVSVVLSRVVVPRLSDACERTDDGREQATQAYSMLLSMWKLF